jgi:hypothetical protein
MKVWAYLAIIALVVGAAGAAAKALHSAGYNKRDQEVQQSIIDAQANAIEEYERGYREAEAAVEAVIVIEERIVEKIREVEIEVPKIIEHIVELTPECKYLGPAYAGLLNDQVRAGNGIQIASPTDPPDG